MEQTNTNFDFYNIKICLVTPKIGNGNRKRGGQTQGGPPWGYANPCNQGFKFGPYQD